MEIKDIQDFIKNNAKVKITNQKTHYGLNITNYQGIISYYPEELVIVVKAGTNNKILKKLLNSNSQGFNFCIDDNKTIGQAYSVGGNDIRDNVLGIKIVDGRGDTLSFGGEVMKNVAGYDVSRLLCGSYGKCGVIAQISFKILPLNSINNCNKPIFKQLIDKKLIDINTSIRKVFDPFNKF